MAKTKVVSVRISWEQYEELLKGALLNSMSLTEWITLHFITLDVMDNNLDYLENQIKDCNIHECPLVQKLAMLNLDDDDSN